MNYQNTNNIYLKLVSNSENWMEAFRTNIGIMRTYYGWSVRVLAEKADVSENTINKIVQGKTNDCDMSIVVKLARAFRISVDELIGARTLDEETQECIAMSRALQPHNRYVIRSYVRHQYKMHRDVPSTSKQISVKLPECRNGHLKTTTVSFPLNIDDLQPGTRSKVCSGLQIPCEHYEPYYMQNEILLLAADRDGLNNEKCVITHGGNYYICIKKIDNVNGEKKVSYISLMDGKNQMFTRDDIDDKIGYVAGFMYPNEPGNPNTTYSWGER